MTRQRVRPSLKRSAYADCPHCGGSGVVKSCESMAIEVVRQLTVASQRPDIAKISIRVAADVAEYLSNKKRRQLIELEDEGKLKVDIVGLPNVSAEHLLIDCRDAADREVRLEA